jgi:hypothetical protein
MPAFRPPPRGILRPAWQSSRWTPRPARDVVGRTGARNLCTRILMESPAGLRGRSRPGVRARRRARPRPWGPQDRLKLKGAAAEAGAFPPCWSAAGYDRDGSPPARDPGMAAAGLVYVSWRPRHDFPRQRIAPLRAGRGGWCQRRLTVAVISGWLSRRATVAAFWPHAAAHHCCLLCVDEQDPTRSACI